MRGFSVWAGAMLTCSAIDAPVAQAQDSSPLQVQVISGAGCLQSDSLRRRVEHYTTVPSKPGRSVRVEYTGQGQASGEFRILRGDATVSRRHFSRLPGDCADRRDAVALAIALALEAYLASDAATETRASDLRGAPGAAAARKSSKPTPGAESGTGTKETRSAAGEDSAAPSERDVEAGVPAAGGAPLEASSTTDEAARDGLPMGDGGEAEPEPAPETASHAAEPADRVNSPARQDASAVAYPIAVSAGAAWVAEGLPWPIWVGMLGAELGVSRRFAVDLTTLASPPSTHPVAGGEARAWLAGAMLSGCVTHAFGAFSVDACAGVLSSLCRVRGTGYGRSYPATNVPWVAGVVRLAAGWPDHAPVQGRVLAQGQVNLVRPELRVDGFSGVDRSALIGALLGTAVVIELN